MGMTVTLDRMIHTKAVHHELGKTIGLGGCCAGGADTDLNPLDLVAMSLGACLLVMMAKAVQDKGLDLTGTCANTSYKLKNYKIQTLAVAIHCPFKLAPADRKFLQAASHGCPVYLAVKDGTDVKISFKWGTKPARKTKAACRCCK